MKKSIFKKIGGLFLGLAMGLGVAVGVAAGNKASEVKAAVGDSVVGGTFNDNVGSTGWTASGTGTYSGNGLKFDGAGDKITANILSKNLKNITVKMKAGHNGGSGSVFTVSTYKSDDSLITSATVTPTDAYTSQQTVYEVTLNGADIIKTVEVKLTSKVKNMGMKYCEVFEAKAVSVDTYTVKLLPGTGSGSEVNDTILVANSYTVPKCSFDAPTGGYEFAGWSCSNGEIYQSGAIIEGSTFTKDQEVTFTALWEIPAPHIDITQDIFGSNTSTSYDTTYSMNYSCVVGGTSSTISVSAKGIYKNAGIQMNTGKGTKIYNTVQMPGYITKIVCTWKEAGKNSPTLYVNGQSQASTSSTLLGTGSNATDLQTFVVENPEENCYRYFYFDGTSVSGTCVLLNLRVYCEEINVKTLKSIAVTTNPSKTSYNAGEKFQTTGMVVKATYGNSQGSDTTETITGYTCNPSTSTALTSSHNKVTISYTESGVTKTTDVAIDVAYFDGIEIATPASKTSYHDGEKFDVSGLVVKAVTKHSNGTTQDDKVDVTNSVTYELGESTATPGTTEIKKGDNQTVTISYNGKTATYTIDCGYAYVTGIEFGVAPETMGPGDTYTPTATVSPLTAEQGKTFTVKSQTEGVLVEFDGETLTISDGTAEGSVTLLVTSDGKKENGEFATDEVTITVSAAAIPQLTGFDIGGTATKATQYLNDTFELDLSGLTITGLYDIENPNPETFGIEDFYWDNDSYDYPYGIYLLNDDLDISLEGYIELVEDFCETIDFVNDDITNKTYYTTDESFDHTGLSISGKMASGADAVIDTSKVEYIFSTTPAELGAGTGKSVSVYAKYGDAETDSITISGIEVKEIALESISITTQPSKLTYTIGESFSSAGILVKGTNNDGSDAGDLTSQCTYEYAETAFLKAGTPTITVKHSSGKTTSFTVTVSAKTLDPGTTTWTLVTESQSDWSGTYILGNSSTNGDIKIAEAGSFSSGSFAIKDATLSDGKLSGTDVKESNAIIITKNPDGDGYAVCANGYYVSRNANSNGIDVSNTPVYGNTISYGSNKVTIAGAGGRVLTYYAQNSNFRYYASSNNCAQLFKLSKSQGENRTLAGITATYNHTGDTYYTGDEVVNADFTVKAWYNNGETENNISGFTITDPILVEGDNTIVLSYEGKTCEVLISDITTRTATVDHVYVEAQDGYQVNYYLDGTTAAWKLEKINVVAYWTDGTTNTSSLGDLVESGDVTLSKAAPEVGDTSFTVSGSYCGTAIDSTHNSVTVNVVAKAITSLSWAKRFDGYSFNVFEGDTINKSAFARQNSSSYIKANFNDGTSDDAYDIDNCSVALYSREDDENVWVKDVTFDEKGNYTFKAEDDGLYFLLTAGGKTTQYSSSAIFHVCERLNAVVVPGDDISKTITTSSFSPVLPTSTSGTGESTAEGITFTYDGLYDYTSSSKHHIALPKRDGAYFASSKLPGDLKSIQITKGGQNINSAASLYISKDGNTWDTAQAFGNTEFTYSVTGEGYRYFKIVTDGSNYTNIGSIVVKYSGNTDVANTNFATQKSVIEFAKYFYEELNEVCNSFDTTSDAFKEAWSNVANKYDEMFGSSSKIEGLDKTLAANMFKYAYPNGRAEEEADILQLAMQRYDTIVARDSNLDAFITRSSTFNAPQINNPITALNNVDNSVWVISAVAVAGLTAIGGYFFYRKRKENF